MPKGRGKSPALPRVVLWVPPPAKAKAGGSAPRGSVRRTATLARLNSPEAKARGRKVVLWDPAWTPRAVALASGTGCAQCLFTNEAHLHGPTLWEQGRELF